MAKIFHSLRPEIFFQIHVTVNWRDAILNTDICHEDKARCYLLSTKQGTADCNCE